MKKHTYWCGWEVPAEIPGNHMATAWPDGVKGWISGWKQSEKYEDREDRIYVGRVDADSVEEARALIAGMYGPSADKIRERWEPEAKEFGYRPTGGRFPE